MYKINLTTHKLMLNKIENEKICIEKCTYLPLKNKTFLWLCAGKFDSSKTFYGVTN